MNLKGAGLTRFAEWENSLLKIQSWLSAVLEWGTCSEPLTKGFPQPQSTGCEWETASGWFLSVTLENHLLLPARPWGYAGLEVERAVLPSREHNNGPTELEVERMMWKLGAPFDSGENRQERTAPSRLG